MTELRLITGRTRKPLSKKLNPIWWFQNDDEEQTAPWYQPQWPQWRRDFYWNFIRNPLSGLCVGAGEGNRTLVISLEVSCCTISRPFFPQAQALEVACIFISLYGPEAF